MIYLIMIQLLNDNAMEMSVILANNHHKKTNVKLQLKINLKFTWDVECDYFPFNLPIIT